MQRFRFIVLLAALVLLILAVPLAELTMPLKHPLVTQVALAVILVAMLLAAVFAASENRRTTWVAALLAVPAVVAQTLDSVIDHQALAACTSVCDIVFFSYVIVVILRHLFRETSVTTNMICASVCVYLLLGIAWADVYSLIDIAQNGAFSYNMADSTAGQDAQRAGGDEPRLEKPMRFRGRKAIYPIYYSFVTLTTLGYGDIVPCTSLSRAFASIQAVMGQLYLAVLVARLVGLHISQSREAGQKPSS